MTEKDPADTASGKPSYTFPTDTEDASRPITESEKRVLDAENQLKEQRIKIQLDREHMEAREQDMDKVKRKYVSQRGGHRGIIGSAEKRWIKIMENPYLIDPDTLIEIQRLIDKSEHALNKYQEISNQLISECFDQYSEDALEDETAQASEFVTRMQVFIHDMECLFVKKGDEFTRKRKEAEAAAVSPDIGLERGTRSAISTYIKTPQIEIPAFSGDYGQWAQFHDLFTSVISQTKMSGTAKMAYLKSLLKGDALVCVSGFPLSDTNFEPALEALERRFQNKKVIVATHIEKIFRACPVMSDANGLLMHRLLEGIVQNLACLVQQGVDINNWDQLLIHITVDKLPDETRRQWGLYKQGTELSTWDELKIWLTNRATALENSGKSQKPDTPKTPTSSHRGGRGGSGGRGGGASSRGIYSAEVTQKYSCPICKTPHTLFACQEFRKKEQPERYTIVRDSHTCMNCLGSTQHGYSKCPNQTSCKTCHQRHHTLLHREGNTDRPVSERGRGGLGLNAVILDHVLDYSPMSPETDESDETVDYSPESPAEIEQVSEVQVQSLNVELEEATTVSSVENCNAQNLVLVAGSPFAKPDNKKAMVLGTVRAQVMDGYGNLAEVRILLDNGSEGNFISEKAVSRLGLKREKCKLSVQPVGPTTPHASNGLVNLSIELPYSSEPLCVEVLVLSKLVRPMPYMQLDTETLTHVHHLELADPTFDQPGEIDILFGVEMYNHVLLDDKPLHDENLRLQKTIFGWAVSGTAKYKNELDSDSEDNAFPSLSVHQVSVSDSFVLREPDEIQTDIKRFWGTEDLPIPYDVITAHEIASKYGSDPEIVMPILTDEQKRAASHFDKTTVRTKDNRLIVDIPIRPGAPALGYSYSVALRQFKSLEKRLAKNPDTSTLYHAFIHEYMNLGHLIPVPYDELDAPHYSCFYIPHHWVEKDSTTTKLRTVYNGSMVTSSGVSLNDIIDVGPKLQDDLWKHLVRFRFFPIAMTADITKMYRQIQLSHTAQDLHRILWRDSVDEAIRIFRMTVVTYGMAGSSYHAIRGLQESANDILCLAAVRLAIKKMFYVDDFIGGEFSEFRAMELQRELHAHLLKHNFILRKWSSNATQLVANLPEELRENAEAFNIRDEEHSLKTLGLRWIPVTDMFNFMVNHIIDDVPNPFSKRMLLSEVSHIFDPLGWLLPVSLNFKLMLQTVWTKGITWDDPLDDDFVDKYRVARNELQALRELQIPRYIMTKINDIDDIRSIELHVFCDASELAYAACIYTRVIAMSGEVKVELLTAKARVAPIKSQSIPRLELCAALLGAKLLKATLLAIEILPLPLTEVYAWTDSTIVLCWLDDIPRQFNTFVSNRTSQILELIPNSKWRHVGTKTNPADIATRGLAAGLLKSHDIWWHGPNWLQCEPFTMPTQPVLKPAQQERKKLPIQIQVNAIQIATKVTKVEKDKGELPEDPNVLPMYKSSDLHKWTKTFAQVLRFVQSFKCSKDKLKVLNQVDGLSTRYQAIRLGIQREQADFFSHEYKLLSSGLQLPKNHQLCNLYPFIDTEDNLIKVGGRLGQATNLTDSQMYPVILPKQGFFAKLVINQTHVDLMHAGLQACMSQIRSQFWIVGLRNAVRFHIKNCVTCKRFNMRAPEPLMGDLPKERITPSPPFYHTGLDFAGPLYLKGPNKQLPKLKVYMAVFVCFSTKAIHLELVSDLTATACLAAFRRFQARRGCPYHMYSDGGTNFVGARRELRQISEILTSRYGQSLYNYVTNLGSNWNIIPPGAPHFGGLWESAVRLAKSHLKRVVGKHLLTFEELSTVLTEVECILNSRPLIEISDDPTDLEVLTPAMLIASKRIRYLPVLDCKPISGDLSNVTPQKIENDDQNSQLKRSNLSTKRWHHIESLQSQFWHRWVHEYIPTLQPRKKWKHEISNFLVGDVVLMTDENTAPLCWPLARILEVYKGNDNVVRTVKLRTHKGIYIRPVVKLRRLVISVEATDRKDMKEAEEARLAKEAANNPTVTSQ